MAPLILAIAALLLAGLAALFAWCALVNASYAVEAALTANYPAPDAIFTDEDGEEFEFRLDRAN